MTKKLYIIIALFIGCFFYAQNIIVKDSLSSLPLEDVLVHSIHDEKEYSKTDHLGTAWLSLDSNDTIRLYLEDYNTKYVPLSKLQKDAENIIYLRNKSFKLDNIIVRGTHSKRKTDNLATNVITLTESDVREYNPATTADLLQQTDEVFIQKSQLGGGSPMIRGFATNRVLIAVDNVNMNNAIFRSGNIQNIIAIDPFTIQNVKVMTGPSSVMFGSDALGGVMSFETKSLLPSQKFDVNGDVSMRYASASEENTAHLDLDFSNKKWASLFSVTFSKFGDARMGRHGPEDYLRKSFVIRDNDQDLERTNDNPLIQRNTAYKQLNLLNKFHFKVSEDLNFETSIMYSRTSDVPRYDRLLRRHGDHFKSAEWYYGPQEWLFSLAKSEYSQPNFAFDSWSSILSHQYFSESRHDRNFGDNWKRNRFERVNLWSWDNNFMKAITHKKKLFYGFDVRLNHINSSAFKTDMRNHEVVDIASRYPDGSMWNQYGVYAKYLSQINQQFNIEAGIRYSYVDAKASFNNEFFSFPFDDISLSTNATTGSIGFCYKPIKGIKINTLLSTGFRAPNIDDIGKVFDSEPGNVVVPNPDLNPEYIYNAEAGISYAIGKILFLKALGYYSYLDDALVRRDYTFNGNSTILYDGELSQVQAIQNASHAEVYGGLLQMEFNLTRNFKLFGKLNFVDGEEELDNGETAPLRHANPIFGNISLESKLRKLKLVLDYDFNGKVRAEDLPPSEREKGYIYALNDEGLPYVPDAHVFNFLSQYSVNDFVTLQFRVDNIFDRRYRPYSSGISALGRNFVFSIRTTF